MADVEIEQLAEGDVEAADAAADRCGEGTFDGDGVFFDGFEGFIGKPGVVAICVDGFFAGVNFHPFDFFGSAIGFFNGGIEDGFHGGRDVDADTVAFDVGDDGVVGDMESVGSHCDFFAGSG